MITGVAQTATAIRPRQEIQGERVLIAGGAHAVLSGLILVVLPAVGILSYAVAFGVLLLITAIRVRSQQSGGGSGRMT